MKHGFIRQEVIVSPISKAELEALQAQKDQLEADILRLSEVAKTIKDESHAELVDKKRKMDEVSESSSALFVKIQQVGINSEEKARKLALREAALAEKEANFETEKADFARNKTIDLNSIKALESYVKKESETLEFNKKTLKESEKQLGIYSDSLSAEAERLNELQKQVEKDLSHVAVELAESQSRVQELDKRENAVLAREKAVEDKDFALNKEAEFVATQRDTYERLMLGIKNRQDEAEGLLMKARGAILQAEARVSAVKEAEGALAVKRDEYLQLKSLVENLLKEKNDAR